jgi:prophage maintenance system killer protein
MLVFLEINGAGIHTTNDEIVRVGISVASGKMKYPELLQWVMDNQ